MTRCAQKEVVKFTTTSNQSDRGNDYLVTERFLNFERLRFTVCRHALWMDSKLKRGGIARDHRFDDGSICNDHIDGHCCLKQIAVRIGDIERAPNH